MILGNTYRHRNTLDTDIYIHSIKSDNKGLWVNISIFDRHTLYVYETCSKYYINNKDINNWKLIS